MTKRIVFLSVPGLRPRDLSSMPNLSALAARGSQSQLTPSFPCVTWPVQANMLTGKLPNEHGVVANGFYWREKMEVEMWTAWNDKILSPQVWDVLHRQTPLQSSAAWFPMLSKGSGADYVCMPAPIHNPDGSESLWCYTKPVQLYGELRDQIGHFPLQHFWGPMANIKSTAWIADSAIRASQQFQPAFWYIYLPHLDYAAQRTGPDSPAAIQALGELDAVIGRLVEGLSATLGTNTTWLVASEYVITPVDHVSYPNRVLREGGLLNTCEIDGREVIDFAQSPAWALVDHQFSHVFVRGREPATTQRVAQLFHNQPGIAEVLAGDQRKRYAIDHNRSGDLILVSTPNSWQAYYWWLDDGKAPVFARTVDIHQKPGYDPVELHVDMATKSIPLNANLVRGSHGAPFQSDSQRGLLVCSREGLVTDHHLRDVDMFRVVMRGLGD